MCVTTPFICCFKDGYQTFLNHTKNNQVCSGDTSVLRTSATCTSNKIIYFKEVHVMNSKTFRTDPCFLRNSYSPIGKYEFAHIRKQIIPLDDIKLLACSDTRKNETPEYKKYGVHFFVDDFRFTGIFSHPHTTVDKYSQYAFLMTPDFSLYGEMPRWRQIESIGKNRWIGAYWQSKGLLIIPTISWSDYVSYDYCFDSVDQGCVVAIGMIGCKHEKRAFLSGYNEMLIRINPEAIICFGDPYPEMEGNVIAVNYKSSRKKVR